MRPIKFREWDINQMRQVDLYFFEEEGIREIPGDERDMVIMQFTGLLDKNGVEIYEGDILGLDDPQDSSRAVVVFHQAGFKVHYPRTDVYSDDFDDWIVIGNIYETPGLLPGSGEVQPEGGTQP